VLLARLQSKLSKQQNKQLNNKKPRLVLQLMINPTIIPTILRQRLNSSFPREKIPLHHQYSASSSGSIHPQMQQHLQPLPGLSLLLPSINKTMPMQNLENQL